MINAKYLGGDNSVIFDNPIGEINNSPTVKTKYPTIKYHIGVLANSSAALAEDAKIINPNPSNKSPIPDLMAEFGLLFLLVRKVHNHENGIANKIINPEFDAIRLCSIHSNQIDITVCE